MQILPINYNLKPYLYNKNNQKQNNITSPYQIPFESRVDKRLPRFENFHEQKKRLPTNLKNYLITIEDKLSITPPEAMKNAYANLMEAKNIGDVQRLFPEEELFIYLTTLKDSISKRGIIGIYKDFEELFKNGILKSGEDFTVYLLRKLFVETKVYKDINDDLDNDLVPDIRDYFRQKYKHNEYITTEILDALGIYRPDKNMRNSLKFTKDGYSDWFGLTISVSLLSRLKNMTEEEKNAEIENRSQGLEEWWNGMSYDEKFELAASVDTEDEGYKSYKKFDNESRKRNRMLIKSLPEFQETEPKKKVKTGIKLNDKDVYILWMQRNLAKFYNSMTENEKIAFEIERSAQQAQRWQEMTPEQRVEYIKSIKEGIEPLRFAMIDAWNHSYILIQVLKEYMQEQQIYKPVELVYDTDEFIDFQSRIMTEFWIQNKDLAEKFGKTMKASHRRVKEAINNGTFEKLKKDILLEKDKRIKKLQEEYKTEAEKIKKAEEEKIKEKEAAIPIEDIQYRKEFAELYKKSIDKYGILPLSYTTEMAGIFLDRFPKDLVIRYGNALKNNEPVPQDIMDYIVKEQEKNDSPRTERIQRALEAAIAAEMTSKRSAHALFLLDVNTLISLLNKRYSDQNVPKAQRIDVGRIAKLYKEYDKNLSDNEMNTIANTYFAANRDLTREENDMLEKYLDSYGRSLLILFSDKSTYSDSIKSSFNEKFLKLMPHKIKEYVHPFIQTPEDIREEREISSLVAQIYKRFKYLPDEILKIYTREVALAVRLDRETHQNKTLENFKNTFYNKAANEKGQNFPGFEKNLMKNEEKFKIIAIEQAMADEFYKVSKNEDIYSRDFEELMNFYDLASIMKFHDKMTMHSEDGTKIFTIKEKPNTKILYVKYLKYLNAIKENKDIINSDGTINTEELLYTLNPQENKPERDKYTKERIDRYFID